MHKTDAKILTKLREVQLGGYECNDDDNNHFVEDFDLAAYFAKLPSMRTIYASPAKNLFVQNPWIEVGYRTSTIEKITIRGEKMDATYMTSCLGSLTALRRFDYYNPWDITDVLDRSGLIAILRALLEHANTSLEFLNLHSGVWTSLQGGVAMPFSLNAFEKLKSATLNCRLWAPVSLEDSEEPQNVRGDDSAVQNSRLIKASKLVDILPSSMETVGLYGKVGVRDVERMLQGLTEHKANRLPRLEEIIFYEVSWLTEDAMDAKMAQELQEQCSGIGIKLVLGGDHAN